MTTLSNVFDVGPQTVYVDVGDGENGSWTWSGSLGKDGSASFTDPSFPGNTITVSVTSGGAVVLNYSAAGSSLVDIYVGLPSGSATAQLVDLTFAAGTTEVTPQRASTGNTGVAFDADLDISGAVAAPNPYAFANVDAAMVYGVFVSMPSATAGNQIQFTVEYGSAPSGGGGSGDSGITFENYTPETPVTAFGVLPRLRGRASTIAIGGGVGRGVLPALRQARGSGIKGPQRLPMLRQAKLPFAPPQRLPRLRGRAAVTPIGGGAGFGRFPSLRGFGSVVSMVPQITLGFGTLPRLTGFGAAKFEMQSTGSGVLPRLRGRALIGAAGTSPFGAGVLPKPSGFGFVSDQSHTAYFSVAQSPGIAYMAGDANVIVQVNDALILNSGLYAQWVQVLQDVVALGSSRSALFNVIQVLSDDVILGDALTLILRELLADTLTVSSAPSSWMGVAIALLDTVRLGSVPTASYDAHMVLLLGFALGSLLFDAQRGYLSDDVALADALIQKINAFALLADSWQIASTQTSSAILYALLSDSAAFSDTRTDYLAITQALLDGAQFGLTLYTGQDQYVAWVMTTPTRAMRRYVNYPFNSFGEINGRLCGANANGLYWLDGDTDAGVEISSMIRSGLMDFGSRQLKRMDRAYMGYTSDGTLGLKVITTSETGDEVAYSYKMVQKPANAPRESRVQIGRGMRSVYWQFELINEAGSDFELHDLTLLPLVLSRRVS